MSDTEVIDKKDVKVEPEAPQLDEGKLVEDINKMLKDEPEKEVKKEPKKEDEKEDDTTTPEGDDDNDLQDDDESTEEDDDSSEEKVDDEKSISDDLIDRAVRVGISSGIAKKQPSAEVLESLIVSFESKQVQSSKSEDKVSDKKEDKVDLLESIPDLNEEEFDKELVDSFKSLKSVIAEQQKALSAQQEIIDGLKSNVVSSEESYFDNNIESLGKGYEELFGKGQTRNLSENSEHRSARDKLQRYVGFMEEDAKTEGLTLTPKELFDRALQSAFGDFVKKTKGQKTIKAAKKRANKALNKPGGSMSSDGLTPKISPEQAEKEAIAAVSEILKDDGI